ncbi:MAG: superoxide dismutase family protein, partial [Gammaproteobacteria bacterium]|nr:superoxide dismutase family protein [Gammaproteobacteria bacterium]
MKLLTSIMMALAATTAAAGTQIEIFEVDKQGTGKSLGTVEIHQSAFGLVFTPNLKALSPGLHGFHVHENPSCDAAEKDGQMVPALAAGGHYDPYNTGKHDTPWGSGHAGDLPPLYVAEDAAGNSC